MRSFKGPRQRILGQVITKLVYNIFKFPMSKKKKSTHQEHPPSLPLQKILDGIVDPFYIIDVQNYRIVAANKAARQLNLTSGTTCYALTHRADKPCWEDGRPCPLKTVVETKKTNTLEHIHYAQTGEPRFFSIHAYPLLDDKGDVKQIIEHAIDITDRKKNEDAIRQAEQNFRQLYEGSRDGYARVALTGEIKEFNQAFAAMLGYSSDELRRLTYEDLTPEKWHPLERQIIDEQVLVRGYSDIYEKEYRAKDGHIFPVELRTSLIHDTANNPIGMWAFVRDIAERKNAAEHLTRLKENLEVERRKLEKVLNIEQKMKSILNLNHLVDFIIEKATQILEVQKCSLMLLDEDSKELVIRGASGLDEDVVSSTRIPLGEGIAGQVAQRGTPLLVNDIEHGELVSRPNRPGYQHKSFMSVPIKLQNRIVGIVNVADKQDEKNNAFTSVDLKILCAIVHQAAIAIENANYYHELEYLSLTDPLTGIYNYRFFIRTLDSEINRGKRYGHSLSLLMVDVDNFKSYNDSFGHLEGDRVLKKISKVLKDNLRAVDVVCRYAGDEFALILPETDIKQAKKVAGKIKEAIENLELKKKVTISVGVGQHSRQADRRDLIMKTDQALYQAKREGKNHICCFQ